MLRVVHVAAAILLLFLESQEATDFEGDFLSGDYPIHDDETPGSSYQHPSPDFSSLTPDDYDTNPMIQRSPQDEDQMGRLKRYNGEERIWTLKRRLNKRLCIRYRYSCGVHPTNCCEERIWTLKRRLNKRLCI